MKSKTRPAALFCILAISLSSALAADPPTESQVRGEIRVARWDVILNENGFESVDSVENSVVHTASVLYDGTVFDANALRDAVNAADAVSGLQAASQSMAFAEPDAAGAYHIEPLNFNYLRAREGDLQLQGNVSGSESCKTIDNLHVHLSLDYTLSDVSITPNAAGGMAPIAPIDKPASIAFTGELGVDEALVFSATITAKRGTPYRHIVVWEAFKAAGKYHQNLQMLRDSERWCRFGPNGIRHFTDVAAAWEAQAKHDRSLVAPKWEQKLGDGKILRLTGVTRSDKWMYCWWDPDGQPIRGDWRVFQSVSNDRPVCFSAEVSGSPDEWKLQLPHGRSSPTGEPGPFLARNTWSDRGPSNEAILGVPVGPWEFVGDISIGHTIRVGDRSYILHDIRSNDGSIIDVTLRIEGSYRPGGDAVTLSAVLQDGTEVDSDSVPSITSWNYGIVQPHFRDPSLSNQKMFHVWKRKQQWVTFNGFAAEPSTKPPTDNKAGRTAATCAREKPHLLPGNRWEARISNEN